VPGSGPRPHREIAEAYGTRFRHLLVDEFQDTNAAQFAIVKALGEHVTTVSVFADDDQAIYRFAGAEAENIRRFIAALGAREYPLTFNYRCREAIIAHANRLIAADPEASGRQMRHVYEGGEVRHRAFRDEDAEAASIAREVQSLIEDNGVAPADISVLARAAWRATPILETLERAGVPTTNWLGEAFEPPERQMLGVILSVLRASMNDRQAKKLCEFLAVPESDERRVQAFLEQAADAPGVSELVGLRDLAYGDAPPSAVIAQAKVCATALDAELADAMTPIVDAVAALEADDPEFTLEHVLSELALGGIGLAPTAGGGVKVASLHRTKGLQWPRVYIVGLEQGTLPDYRTETEAARSEERRACFVGVCRAETHLTLTRIEQYRGFRKPPSIFLEEMGIDPYD
jgi:DNA helicase-2/ATP-dependent DNA helicase PcrA